MENIKEIKSKERFNKTSVELFYRKIMKSNFDDFLELTNREEREIKTIIDVFKLYIEEDDRLLYYVFNNYVNNLYIFEELKESDFNIVKEETDVLFVYSINYNLKMW